MRLSGDGFDCKGFNLAGTERWGGEWMKAGGKGEGQ